MGTADAMVTEFLLVKVEVPTSSEDTSEAKQKTTTSVVSAPEIRHFLSNFLFVPFQYKSHTVAF